MYDRQFPVDFKANPIPVIKEKTTLTLADVIVVPGEPEAMDTS